MNEYEFQNIGELADESLRKLTLVEEELDIAIRNGNNHPEDLRDAAENLEDAQRRIAEILNRWEDEMGPI